MSLWVAHIPTVSRPKPRNSASSPGMIDIVVWMVVVGVCVVVEFGGIGWVVLAGEAMDGVVVVVGVVIADDVISADVVNAVDMVVGAVVVVDVMVAVDVVVGMVVVVSVVVGIVVVVDVVIVVGVMLVIGLVPSVGPQVTCICVSAAKECWIEANFP